MSNKRTFTVATVGIPASEQAVLKNIFKLSAYRTRSYALVSLSADKPPEILMVDADDESALAEWRGLSKYDADRPTVMVTTKDKPAEPKFYNIRKPFIATRVLGVLDQVAIKELSYIPELVIGGENKAASVESFSPAEVAKKETTATAEQPRHRALVVDDSLPVRKQIEIELQLLGINGVDFAETGERALEFLDEKSYDIIFLDVVLPGVDGYKICKTIKKDKLKKQTPVIMLTGKGSPFDKVRGKLAGCDTYMTKPVAHEAFQKVVKKYLG